MRVTDTHDKIIEFVTEYEAEHGYMPDTKEIAKAVDVCNNTVCFHMVRMIKLGIFETDLKIKNDYGECSRTAWMTRGYRFGKGYRRDKEADEI